MKTSTILTTSENNETNYSFNVFSTDEKKINTYYALVDESEGGENYVYFVDNLNAKASRPKRFEDASEAHIYAMQSLYKTKKKVEAKN